MPDLNKIAKALRLFNEKAEKLARLNFMAKLTHPNAGVTISFNNPKEGGATVTQERRGPDEEAIDAFVLTFRYFIQDNEQTSFRNMEQHYLAAPLDPALQKQFVDLRSEINKYRSLGRALALHRGHLALDKISRCLDGRFAPAASNPAKISPRLEEPWNSERISI